MENVMELATFRINNEKKESRKMKKHFSTKISGAQKKWFINRIRPRPVSKSEPFPRETGFVAFLHRKPFGEKRLLSKRNLPNLLDMELKFVIVA